MTESDLLFPANLTVLREAREHAARILDVEVPGLLELREGACLYVLARRGERLGDIVEIGSYMGRSTVFLARALEDARSSRRVIAIDPHLEGTREAFEDTLAGAGVSHRVDARVAYSADVVGTVRGPFGVLWIDGDHSYAAVRRDFDDWFPSLAIGGWVAIHDTANQWHGPTRLVRELLLRRADLAHIGLIGTLVFAQKVRPAAVNRLRAVTARASFEVVTFVRGRRFGRGPRNVAAADRS